MTELAAVRWLAMPVGACLCRIPAVVPVTSPAARVKVGGVGF